MSGEGGTMTEEELERIEALARAATPGPWSRNEKHGAIVARHSNGVTSIAVGMCDESNEAFIAGTGPDIILSMIANLRLAAHRYVRVSDNNAELGLANTRMHAASEQMGDQIDDLRSEVARLRRELSATNKTIREQREAARVDVENAEAHELSSTRRAEKAEAERDQLRDRLESVEHVRGEERAAWMAECARLRSSLPDEDVIDALLCLVSPGDACSNELGAIKVIRPWFANLVALRAEAGDE